MASAQYNRYIWLVDTIRSAGKITRAEIDRKWSNSHYNENHESTFPDRSFFRCKREIKSIFGIEIKCKRSRECSIYYIANPDDDSHSQTKQWLLSEFALSQSLDASRELQDQIVYEHIPEGTQYLTTIVEALRDHKILLISHLRFDSNEPPHVFYMSPLCLKAFKQRWYIIGLIEELDGTNKTGNEPRTYALDRVKHLELTDRKFKYPKNFHPQEYFAPHYGVFCGKDYKPEFIRARFSRKRLRMSAPSRCIIPRRKWSPASSSGMLHPRSISSNNSAHTAPRWRSSRPNHSAISSAKTPKRLPISINRQIIRLFD